MTDRGYRNQSHEWDDQIDAPVTIKSSRPGYGSIEDGLGSLHAKLDRNRLLGSVDGSSVGNPSITSKMSKRNRIGFEYGDRFESLIDRNKGNYSDRNLNNMLNYEKGLNILKMVLNGIKAKHYFESLQNIFELSQEHTNPLEDEDMEEFDEFDPEYLKKEE